MIIRGGVFDCIVMAELPFEISIHRTSGDGGTERVACRALLREIAGKRQVYDGVWGERGVIVKVFGRGLRARRHVRREWRGLEALRERGVRSPEGLFTGRTADGRWAVVVERIADSRTALEMLDSGGSVSERASLLGRIARELAGQHAKGVLQGDFHMGNFLLAGEEIYCLDPAEMRFLDGPVSKEKAISQLALLVILLPEGERDSIRRVCSEYFAGRGWQLEAADEELIGRRARASMRKGIRQALGKSLRSGSRYVRLRTGTGVAMFVRDFCPVEEMGRFTEEVDSLVDGGERIKRGNTCHVSRVQRDGRDIVIKRYNHKGLIHSLRHTLMRSRARRGWLNGHRLLMLGIRTPRPVAYIERMRGPIVWRSYLVTEYVEGTRLREALAGGGQEWSEVSERVLKILEELAGHGITHGDLKHTNILLTGDGPVLTDLDGMKVHRFGGRCRSRYAKDVESFTTRGRRAETF